MPMGGCWLSVVGCLMLVVGCRLSVGVRRWGKTKRPATPVRSYGPFFLTVVGCQLSSADNRELILHTELGLNGGAHVRSFFAVEQYLLVEDELVALFFGNGLDGFVYLFVDGL